MSEIRILTLGPDCTIRTIRLLQGDLIAALSETTDLTLDCDAVERADIAFVQIVLSAARTARHQSKTVALANVSPVAEAAFQRAGIATDLSLAS